jgi:hypothetical protein
MPSSSEVTAEMARIWIAWIELHRCTCRAAPELEYLVECLYLLSSRGTRQFAGAGVLLSRLGVSASRGPRLLQHLQVVKH